MILVNGCPKSGTHALMSQYAAEGMRRVPGICKSLGPGQPVRVYSTPADPLVVLLEDAALLDGFYMHGHVRASAADAIPDDVDVHVVVRDPRNVIISLARWANLSPLARVLDDFFGHSFVPLYRDFLGWRDVPGATVTRYEDYGRPMGTPDAVYAGAREDRSTYNATPSDWRRCPEWSRARFQAAWFAHGGPGLVKEAGYEEVE